MGGSPKSPKVSDSQLKAEGLQTELMQTQLEQAKANATLKVPTVKPLKPIPPPAPPTTQTSADAEAAAQQAKRDALRRTNSNRGTLFAGETGGYKGALAPKTLLA